jgi:hypothetical protein
MPPIRKLRNENAAPELVAHRKAREARHVAQEKTRGKKFSQLSAADKDDLLRAMSIQLGFVEE